MELLVDIAGDTDRANSLHLARGRTEGDAVEDVDDRLVGTVTVASRAQGGGAKRETAEKGSQGCLGHAELDRRTAST